jgi:hypothetical protein
MLAIVCRWIGTLGDERGVSRVAVGTPFRTSVAIGTPLQLKRVAGYNIHDSAPLQATRQRFDALSRCLTQNRSPASEYPPRAQQALDDL